MSQKGGRWGGGWNCGIADHLRIQNNTYQKIQIYKVSNDCIQVLGVEQNINILMDPICLGCYSIEST